jgi:hypothetical protein
VHGTVYVLGTCIACWSTGNLPDLESPNMTIHYAVLCFWLEDWGPIILHAPRDRKVGRGCLLRASGNNNPRSLVPGTQGMLARAARQGLLMADAHRRRWAVTTTTTTKHPSAASQQPVSTRSCRLHQGPFEPRESSFHGAPIHSFLFTLGIHA